MNKPTIESNDLTTAQVALLRQLRRSGPVPLNALGVGSRMRTLCRKNLSKTEYVESFIGQDGATWIRLSHAGHTYADVLALTCTPL